MNKLPDPERLRLNFDVTYRLTRESYCLISCGVFSKQRVRGEQAASFDRGFSSQFHELCLGLVTSESDNSYQRLMRGFVLACRKICNYDPTGRAVGRRVGVRLS